MNKLKRVHYFFSFFFLCTVMAAARVQASQLLNDEDHLRPSTAQYAKRPLLSNDDKKQPQNRVGRNYRKLEIDTYNQLTSTVNEQAIVGDLINGNSVHQCQVAFKEAMDTTNLSQIRTLLQKLQNREYLKAAMQKPGWMHDNFFDNMQNQQIKTRFKEYRKNQQTLVWILARNNRQVDIKADLKRVTLQTLTGKASYEKIQKRIIKSIKDNYGKEAMHRKERGEYQKHDTDIENAIEQKIKLIYDEKNYINQLYQLHINVYSNGTYMSRLRREMKRMILLTATLGVLELDQFPSY